MHPETPGARPTAAAGAAVSQLAMEVPELDTPQKLQAMTAALHDWLRAQLSSIADDPQKFGAAASAVLGTANGEAIALSCSRFLTEPVPVEFGDDTPEMRHQWAYRAAFTMAQLAGGMIAGMAAADIDEAYIQQRRPSN